MKAPDEQALNRFFDFPNGHALWVCPFFMGLKMSLQLLQPGHTCGDHCWHARELDCKCSCGGKNHGILLRGGEKPTRTRKIGGQFYEMMEIGNARQIEQRRMDLIRECGHDWFFDPSGPYLAKPVTGGQAKWSEVMGVEGDTYILWANPSLVRHKVVNAKTAA